MRAFYESERGPSVLLGVCAVVMAACIVIALAL